MQLEPEPETEEKGGVVITDTELVWSEAEPGDT